MLSGRPRLGVKPPILQSVKYWSRWVWNGRKWAVEGGLKGQLSTDRSRSENELDKARGSHLGLGKRPCPEQVKETQQRSQGQHHEQRRPGLPENRLSTLNTDRQRLDPQA
jgi:hypothetical protein